MMELKVKAITFPEVIEFNFEELKQEITERTSAYLTLVYDDSQIKEAKKDKATLNKFVEALSKERIKIKKDCLKPYEEFERKINELSSIVDGAIKNIDTQIKSYEEQQKAEKKKQIENYWEELSKPDWLQLEQLWKQNWLNASMSLSKVKGELETEVAKIRSNLTTLSNLPEFAFEAVEVYKTTLDVNQAVSEGHRLLELQKKKAEQAEKQKQVSSYIRGCITGKNPYGTCPCCGADGMKCCAGCEEDCNGRCGWCEKEKETIIQKEISQQSRQWVSFQALLSMEEALALKKFFKEHQIEFKPI